MEDKTFELLEKMYVDFSKRFERIETNISGMKSEMSDMKNEIGKIGAKIDRPINDRLTSLEDGYKATYEKLDVVEKKIDILTDKVDSHDIRIEVIEGGKKRNIK